MSREVKPTENTTEQGLVFVHKAVGMCTPVVGVATTREIRPPLAYARQVLRYVYSEEQTPPPPPPLP